LDSGVLSDEQLNERTKQRFASLSDVVNKLKPEFRQDHSGVLKRSDKSNSYKMFSVCPNKKLENTIKDMS
jgi:hypothetical protein